MSPVSIYQMNRNNFLLSVLFLCVSSVAFALDDDKNQPMHLNADTVSIDNQTGESQYIGHVVVIQGTTHLTAASASVFTDSDGNAIKEAIAKGDEKVQAHYWTLNDPKKPELHAYADTIKIFPKENLVYLIGHAKVTQGTDSYEAPEIQYDTKTHHAFSPKSKLGQTVIVIHPQNTQ